MTIPTIAYSLTGIQCAYANGPAVLEIENLDFQSKNITALIGPNGAGKSTLLSVLAFLKAPNAGRLQYFGRDCSNKNLLQLRRRVGLVAQKPYFLSGSVTENVELGLRLRGVNFRQRRKQASRALQQVDAQALSDQSVKTLSGGEAQRIALARVLVLQPDVLLLDEPFTFLDTGVIKTLEKLFVALVAEFGTTIIFSTHDRFHAMLLADHVVSLVNGCITESPLINFYSGKIVDGFFDTGHLKIQLPEPIQNGSYVCIDPNEIVLSEQPLISTMRNRYPAVVTSITVDSGNIRMTVDGPEQFQVLITRQALDDFGFKIGEEIWVNFKSTAVEVVGSYTTKFD